MSSTSRHSQPRIEGERDRAAPVRIDGTRQGRRLLVGVAESPEAGCWLVTNDGDASPTVTGSTLDHGAASSCPSPH